MKTSKTHKLATKVAGRRRSLENAILKLAEINFDVGWMAAENASISLRQLSDHLTQKEIMRLKEQIHPKEDK